MAVPLAKNDQKLSPAATEKPSSNFVLKSNPNNASYELMIVDDVPNTILSFLSPDKLFACKFLCEMACSKYKLDVLKFLKLYLLNAEKYNPVTGPLNVMPSKVTVSDGT